jgi:hypothetical protein
MAKTSNKKQEFGCRKRVNKRKVEIIVDENFILGIPVEDTSEEWIRMHPKIINTSKCLSAGKNTLLFN